MVTSTKPLNKDISFVYDDASIVFKTVIKIFEISKNILFQFNPRTKVPHIQGDNLLLRMEAALQRYRMHQKKDLVVILLFALTLLSLRHGGRAELEARLDIEYSFYTSNSKLFLIIFIGKDKFYTKSL